jgi:hypothetical protein
MFSKASRSPEYKRFGDAEVTLLIDELAVVKMETYIEEASPNEVGWLGVVDKISETEYRCKDVYMLTQHVHGATTEITSEGLVAFAEEYGDDIVSRCMMWGHSHVNMGVSPSGQDMEQMKLFINNGMPWFFRVIANKKSDIGVTFFNYDNGYYIEDCKWELTPREDHTATIAVAKAEVKKHVLSFPVIVSTWGYGRGIAKDKDVKDTVVSDEVDSLGETGGVVGGATEGGDTRDCIIEPLLLEMLSEAKASGGTYVGQLFIPYNDMLELVDNLLDVSKEDRACLFGEVYYLSPHNTPMSILRIIHKMPSVKNMPDFMSLINYIADEVLEACFAWDEEDDTTWEEKDYGHN